MTVFKVLLSPGEFQIWGSHLAKAKEEAKYKTSDSPILVAMDCQQAIHSLFSLIQVCHSFYQSLVSSVADNDIIELKQTRLDSAMVQ